MHDLAATSRTPGAPSLPGGAPGSARRDEISSVMHDHGYTTREVLDWLIAKCATGASAAGSDGQVTFNDGGTPAGDAGLTYDKTTNTLTVESVRNWTLYTVNYDNAGLVVASTTGSVELFTTAAGMIVEVMAANTDTFVLGKADSITATIGIFGNETLLADSLDGSESPGYSATKPGHFVDSGLTVYLFVTGVSDLNGLSAGSMNIYVRASVAPT